MPKLIFAFTLILIGALSPAAFSQKMPSGEEVVKRYADIIGGARVWEMKNSEFRMKITQGEKEFDGVIIKMSPDKYYQSIVGSGFSLIQIYNAGNVLSIINGKKKELTEEKDTEELKLQSNILPDLVYTKLGYKITMLGEEKVNGARHYAVEIISPLGAKKINYYEKASGLLKFVKKNGSKTFFTDYKTIKGRVIPFTFVTIFPEGSKMMFKVTKWFINKRADPALFDLNKY
jgi:hypothetical protein